MFDISNMSESPSTNHMKDKKHLKWVPTISGSQSIYFNKSESIDLSASSEGSNNHLSAHSTSSISKSLLDSVMVSASGTHAEICRTLKRKCWTMFYQSTQNVLVTLLDNYSKLCFQIVN